MYSATITDRAMLVDLTIKRWSASATDKRMARDAAQRAGAAEHMIRVTKQLLEHDSLTELSSVATAAGTAHRMMTLAWSDNGERILASAMYLQYTATMRGFETQYLAALDSFEAAYPALYSDAQALLNGAFDPKNYPDPSRIREKFGFGYRISPLPSSSDFRIELGDENMTAIRESYEQSLRDCLENSQRDIADRIREAVTHMVDRIEAYNERMKRIDANGGVSTDKRDTFRDTVVTNIRELAAMLPALNIQNDPEIAALTARIETELCATDPGVLREDTAAREATEKAANDILAQLSAFAA